MKVINLADLAQIPPFSPCSRELPRKPAAISLSKCKDIESATPAVNDTIVCQEATQLLALRLLDSNIGYSNHETGDENCAYFIDGGDNISTGQESFCFVSWSCKPQY